MSQVNLALARRWFDELWNQRNESLIDELLTPDSVCYSDHGPICGVDEFRKSQYIPFTSAFSESHIEIEDMVADRDFVVVRWNFTGKHSGDLEGHAATNQHVYFSGMTWIRYSQGKMMEGWQCSNLPKLVPDPPLRLPPV
ncbi:MAG TPA: ester cyclase [Pirellulales bacterium]